LYAPIESCSVFLSTRTFQTRIDTKGDDTTSLLGRTCNAKSQSVEVRWKICVELPCSHMQSQQRTFAAEDMTLVTFEFIIPAQIIQYNSRSIRVEPTRWPVSWFTATLVQRIDEMFQYDTKCATKKAFRLTILCNLENISCMSHALYIDTC
jgi:hypothetical protein